MIKRIVFLLLLGLAAFKAAGFSAEQLANFFAKDESSDTARLSEAKGSVGYVLDENRWTLFALPRDFESILARVAPNFKAPFAPEPGRRYPFQLRYQVLDRNRKVLTDKIHHLNGDLSLYEDETGENRTSSKFYIGRTLVPGDVRSIFVDMPAASGAAYIRFKTEQKDTAIKDAILWAFHPAPASGANAAYAWTRSTEEKKDRLARGSVYPHELLSDFEKRNLLNSQWDPLGPVGIENKDYFSRRVYVANETEGERVEPPVVPEGFYLGARHRATLPIAKPGELLLETRTPHGALPSETDRLPVRWFAEDGPETREFFLAWPDLQSGKKIPVAPGLLEIGPPPVDLVFKAFLTDPETGGKTETTPEPYGTRTFRLSPEISLGYVVRHMDGLSTPVRIVLRTILSGPDDEKGEAPSVRFRLVGRDGETKGEGVLRPDAGRSVYDWFEGEDGPVSVSEPFAKYMSVSPEIGKILFDSDEPVLISLYNRPPGLSRKTFAPADYRRTYQREIGSQSWYAVFPENRNGLIDEGHSVVVTAQIRPPEENVEIALGKYRWESFQPEGAWTGRFLFVPVEKKGVFRKELLPSVYRPLERNAPVALDFSSPMPGASAVSPSVVYLRKSESPGAIGLTVDGNAVGNRRVVGSMGQFDLDAVDVGKRVLRATFAPGERLYVNYAGRGPGARTKRFANRLDASGLQFEYAKQSSEAEVLMVHFFAPYGREADSVLKVEISGAKRLDGTCLDDWTLLKREFVVAPNPESPVPVFHSGNERTDEGRLLFLPLGADLSPGKFKVKIAPEAGATGYLIFSKITPGVGEKRTVFKDAAMFGGE